MSIKLFCVVKGTTTPFPVDIDREETVDDLKKAIKREKPNDFAGIDADRLRLWQVEILANRNDLIQGKVLKDDDQLDATDYLNECWTDTPLRKHIHVIVEVPAERRVETAPRDLLYIFVDNSNLFIQGRYSVGLHENIGSFNEAENCKYFGDLFIDYGQLLEKIRGERDLGNALLVGSKPPDTDSVWRHAREKGFEVKVYDKNFRGCEKKVDMKIGTAITRTVSTNRCGTIALVAGDGDYEPALEFAQQDGWNIELWSWRRENSLELLNGGKPLHFTGLSGSLIEYGSYHPLNYFYWAFTYGLGCHDDSCAIDVTGAMCSWTVSEMLNWCYDLRIFGWWDQMNRSRHFRLYFSKKRDYKIVKKWMEDNKIEFWDVA